MYLSIRLELAIQYGGHDRARAAGQSEVPASSYRLRAFTPSRGGCGPLRVAALLSAYVGGEIQYVTLVGREG